MKFLYVDDMAEASIFILQIDKKSYQKNIDSMLSHINIGSSRDVSILELAETVKKVIFPAALPGIVGSILLAVSRAVGETMIVVMASGLAANLTMNPLESTSTITAQIVVILIGDQQFGDPKTQSAFALGISLFIVTLFLNVIALSVVKKYREKYE